MSVIVIVIVICWIQTNSFPISCDHICHTSGFTILSVWQIPKLCQLWLDCNWANKNITISIPLYKSNRLSDIDLIIATMLQCCKWSSVQVRIYLMKSQQGKSNCNQSVKLACILSRCSFRLLKRTKITSLEKCLTLRTNCLTSARS